MRTESWFLWTMGLCRDERREQGVPEFGAPLRRCFVLGCWYQGDSFLIPIFDYPTAGFGNIPSLLAETPLEFDGAERSWCDVLGSKCGVFYWCPKRV